MKANEIICVHPRPSAVPFFIPASRRARRAVVVQFSPAFPWRPLASLAVQNELP
jgi:hypothetical protein